MRKLPEGHPLPQRPHWKHGRYWYVYRNQWEPLPRTHTEAISAWSIGVNRQAGMTELVDSVLIAIEKRATSLIPASDSSRKRPGRVSLWQWHPNCKT